MVVGRMYVEQCTTNLASPVWLAVTNFVAVTNSITFTNTVLAGQEFYRVTGD
jgi:hypothetical protein